MTVRRPHRRGAVRVNEFHGCGFLGCCSHIVCTAVLLDFKAGKRSRAELVHNRWEGLLIDRVGRLQGGWPEEKPLDLAHSAVCPNVRGAGLEQENVLVVGTRSSPSET